MRKMMKKSWIGLFFALVLMTTGGIVWAQNGYGPMANGRGYGYGMQQQGPAGSMQNGAAMNRPMRQGYGRGYHRYGRHQGNGYAMDPRRCPYFQQRTPMNQGRRSTP